MATLKYKIELTSFWHTGSGLSSGTESDLVVIKDENGLPYVPGKTLKGLLREAAENINLLQPNLVTKHFINEVFGEKSDETGDLPPKEAISFFSDGYLTETIRQHLNGNLDQKELLFRYISSTRIDNMGQAEDHSLRKTEVTIPLDLYAEIVDFNEEFESQMQYCFKWVKKLGYSRTRGLGRCKISILNIG